MQKATAGFDATTNTRTRLTRHATTDRSTRTRFNVDSISAMEREMTIPMTIDLPAERATERLPLE